MHRQIETALKRMPGVSDVELNFATETLELSLAPDAPTQASDIEKTIKSLGFGISANTGQQTVSAIDIDSDNQMAPQDKRWWQTQIGKQVVGLGILMGSAYAVTTVPRLWDMGVCHRCDCGRFSICTQSLSTG